MSLCDFDRVIRWLLPSALLRWVGPRLLAALVLLAAVPMLAGAQDQSSSPPLAAEPVLEVFVREGCPHCVAAKAYLGSWAQQHPWLRVVYRPVDSDVSARDALVALTRQAGYWPPGVPTFVFQGQVLVGFEDPSRSGPALDALVARAAPTPSDMSTPARVDAGRWGVWDVGQMGLPLFTLAIGLLDGFNPCAMWVLLFLLSLLVHLHDRRRMALIAACFVLVSGAVYYGFMAAWLNVFLAVGMTATMQTALALLALMIAAFNIKDFVVGPHGVSLSIPARAKPGLYARMRALVQARSLSWALLGAASLAVVVNLFELLCTAGLPAMYTAILSQQQLGALAYHAYLGLYILGYIADDSLMVTMAVMALSSRKLNERTGRWLKLVSGLVMLALGLVMLLCPDWLV